MSILFIFPANNPVKEWLFMDSGTAMTRCPGCGLCLPNSQHETPERFNASGECWQQYSDLLCYTVAKRDTGFIHQHAVDAYASQHSGGTTRNSSIAFGLIGLYLALEKGYTGRQVQLAHMRIARIQKTGRGWSHRLSRQKLP